MPRVTPESDLDDLALLGKESTPAKKLEVFPNHHRERDYTVTLRTAEFTCLCPMTGQPDFATITITYIPDKSIVESKSLKLYLWSFRNEGAFHEHVTNTILDDLVKAMEPRWCKVSAAFARRGGIAITVDGEYKKAGLPPPQPSPSHPYKAGGERYHAAAPRWQGERGRSRTDWGTNRHKEEKRLPAQREHQADTVPKRSERKTTKSLGVTRTWRKRM